MFENLPPKQKRFSRLDGKKIDFRAYKDDAPNYPTTKIDPTLYGSSVTNASGTTYNPTDFEKSLVNTSEGGITKTLNNLINPTYDSPDFKQYQSDLQNQQKHDFENSVVNPLVSKGLLGTSAVNNLSNMFGNTVAQQESDLRDKYYNRNNSLLQTLMSTYAMPYDMYSGTSGLSTSLANSVANYNKDIYTADQATKAAMYKAVGDAVGGLGSAAGGYFSE